MLSLFQSTAAPYDDAKLIARYIKKYGNAFHEHLNISKRDAIAVAKELDYAYHSENKKVVPDEYYDIFKDWIVRKWPDSKYVGAVGAPVVKKGAKAKSTVVEEQLPVPMASQDKLKPGQDFDKFLTASMYTISDKLDGISLELVYTEGVPTACYTRGDGIRGQNVSGVIPALKIPTRIPVKGIFILRSEFLIKKHTFSAKHSKHEGTGDFAAARNMGGGLLKRNQPSNHVRDFDVVSYEILKGKGAGQRKSLQLTLLKKYGFAVVRHRIIPKLNEKLLVELLAKFKKTAQYEIDGIIVEHDDAYRVSAKNPKHSRAFKMNSLEDTLIVPIKDIEWNDSRHNRFIPRIIIDPIILGGVEVQHFTGHNYFYIQHGYTTKEAADAKKAGKILPIRPLGKGAMIRVVRSGDVIPYIMEVVKPARVPSKPPGTYTLNANGVHAMKGGSTIAIKQKRIVHFFNTLDVEGVKDGVVAKLYEAGYNTIRKVLRITVADLLQIEGFKETSAKKLVNNLKDVKKNATFATLGYASAVFGDKVGSSKLQAIIDDIPNIVELTRKLSTPTLEAKIRGVHSIKDTAKVIAEKLPEYLDFIDRLGIKLAPEVRQEVLSQRLTGFKILLTSVRDADLVAAVKANGGEEAGSVKTATHVITKPGASNNKTEEAKAKNIPVMTVDEFKKKYKV